MSGVEREAGAGAVDPRADELAHLILWHRTAGNSATVSFLRGYSALTQTNADLLAALEALLGNARLIPDPGMAGTTDCYAVPLDDIAAARAAIAKANGQEQQK